MANGIPPGVIAGGGGWAQFFASELKQGFINYISPDSDPVFGPLSVFTNAMKPVALGFAPISKSNPYNGFTFTLGPREPGDKYVTKDDLAKILQGLKGAMGQGAGAGGAAVRPRAPAREGPVPEGYATDQISALLAESVSYDVWQLLNRRDGWRTFYPHLVSEVSEELDRTYQAVSGQPFFGQTFMPGTNEREALYRMVNPLSGRDAKSEAIGKIVAKYTAIPELQANPIRGAAVRAVLGRLLGSEEYVGEIQNTNGTVTYVPKKVSSFDPLQIATASSNMVRGMMAELYKR